MPAQRNPLTKSSQAIPSQSNPILPSQACQDTSFVTEALTCPSPLIVYDDGLPVALPRPLAANQPLQTCRRSPQEALMSSSPPTSGSDTTFDSQQFALPYA